MVESLNNIFDPKYWDVFYHTYKYFFLKNTVNNHSIHIFQTARCSHINIISYLLHWTVDFVGFIDKFQNGWKNKYILCTKSQFQCRKKIYEVHISELFLCLFYTAVLFSSTIEECSSSISIWFLRGSEMTEMSSLLWLLVLLLPVVWLLFVSVFVQVVTTEIDEI